MTTSVSRVRWWQWALWPLGIVMTIVVSPILFIAGSIENRSFRDGGLSVLWMFILALLWPFDEERKP